MNIETVQIVRKVVLFVAIALALLIFAVTTSRYPSGGRTHEFIEWAGIVLIVVCILGRTWASLYIGGRKVQSLVQTGPYSVSRNPLYFFSFLGAAGAGAQMGSVVLALVAGALAYVVFYTVVLQEERLLIRRHGDAYRAYLASVPRFVPRPSLWKDTETIEVRPPRVLMTFADALVFLLAVPLAEGFEYLQEAGILPVLLRLP